MVTGSDACAAHEHAIEINRVKQPAGSEVLVDAGIHEVRVVDRGSKRVADQTLNAAAGQRHVVELGFAQPGAAYGGTEQAPPSSTGVATFLRAGDVVGAVGVLALGAAAAVYVLARSDVALRRRALRVGARLRASFFYSEVTATPTSLPATRRWQRRFVAWYRLVWGE